MYAFNNRMNEFWSHETLLPRMVLSSKKESAMIIFGLGRSSQSSIQEWNELLHVAEGGARQITLSHNQPIHWDSGREKSGTAGPVGGRLTAHCTYCLREIRTECQMSTSQHICILRYQESALLDRIGLRRAALRASYLGSRRHGL